MAKDISSCDDRQLRKLLIELSDLRIKILRRSFYSGNFATFKAKIQDPDDLKSITNLRHYLAFRSEDLRPLQERLATLGLSSLGRSEVHVIDAVERVLSLLRRLLLPHLPPAETSSLAISRSEGQQLLRRNTERLLGPPPLGREVRIMVTLPSEAAHNYNLVRNLVKAGMDVARINCAHDQTENWLQMITNIRRATRELDRPLTIVADLAGHKIRTGELALKTGVLHLRPKRDDLGRVLSPARLRLQRVAGVSPEAEPEAKLDQPKIQVSLLWDGETEEERQWDLAPGDRLLFTDSRGAKRVAIIDTVDAAGAWANLRESTFLINGITWRLERGDQKKAAEMPESESTPPSWTEELANAQKVGPEGEIEEGRELPAEAKTAPPARLKGEKRQGIFSGIPQAPINIQLRCADLLLLTKDPLPAQAEVRDDEDLLLQPAQISCTLPQVFEVLQVGQQVWIDDGKFGAEVVELTKAGALLKINSCRPEGARLLANKGLNFPNLELPLSGLAQDDLVALEALAGKVEVIGFSYVETAAHIRELLTELSRLGAEKTGIIAKIETPRAFRNMAKIALAAMGQVPFGIMIARGDLAMEVGPERLVEVQEEILWLAESAHLPVIWATQVLETLVKKGVVSRPEMTDAAMGARAECVMLNKGPFIERGLSSLNNILSRMQEHQRKKSSRLRALCWGEKNKIKLKVG